MALGGWIKVHRALLDHHVSSDPSSLSIWMHLLMLANHTETKRQINGRVVTLKPGQLITSRKSLSEKTGVNESKVTRVLNMLESEQQIEQHGTSKFRVISIVNWLSYQETEQVSEQQVNGKRTASEQQVNTPEEVSISPNGDTDTQEGKNGKKEKTSAPSAKKSSSIPAGEMIDLLPGLGLHTAEEYRGFRNAKKAPLTAGAWKKIASEVQKSGLPPDDALNTAMARNWQGFDASWLQNRQSGFNGMGKQEAIEAHNQRVVEEIMRREQQRIGATTQDDFNMGDAITIDGEVINAY